jgi:hypothetical protein
MELEQFIVEAKAQTYVSGGQVSSSSRLAYHDLHYENGECTYLDSYFGGTDFVRQEAVWHKG